MMRRLLVGLCVLVAATSSVAAGAGAAIPPQGRVGPNQYFGGLVNRKNDSSGPVTIRMACFGAIRPGQRGHPMAGQTVEVFLPEVIVLHHSGFTGKHANRIVAFFGSPPPTAVPPTPSTSTVTFRTYGVNKAIPTSLLLPCGGTGTVHFVPLPMSPPKSHPATVRVSYVGQP
jgi:hypothetical protein